MRTRITTPTPETIRRIDSAYNNGYSLQEFVAKCDRLFSALRTDPALNQLLSSPKNTSISILRDDILNWEELAERFLKRTDPVSSFLWNKMRGSLRERLIDAQNIFPKNIRRDFETQAKIVNFLNSVVHRRHLNKQLFAATTRRPKTGKLFRRSPKVISSSPLKRMLLEDQYPWLRKFDERKGVLEDLHYGLLLNLIVIESNLQATGSSYNQTLQGQELSPEFQQEIADGWRKFVAIGHEMNHNRRSTRSKNLPRCLPLDIKAAIEAGIMAGARCVALNAYLEAPKGGRRLQKGCWDLAQMEEDRDPDRRVEDKVKAALWRWAQKNIKLLPGQTFADVERSLPIKVHSMVTAWSQRIKPNPKRRGKRCRASKAGSGLDV